LPRLPKGLPLHHPTADELHHAHAVYTEKEPTEYAHRLTRELLAGDTFTAGEAVHALLRIWSPTGSKTTPADITGNPIARDPDRLTKKEKARAEGRP